MKKLVLVLVLGLVSLLAGTSAVAATELKCVSFDVIDGWTGSPTRSRIFLTAQVGSDARILDAEIRGAYHTDKRDLSADRNYKPKNPKYLAYNRYSVLEDAWCWFSPLLPKNLTSIPLRKPFTGYVQRVCEEGQNIGTIGMSCTQK